MLNQPSYRSIKQQLIQRFEPDLGSRVSEFPKLYVITDEWGSQFFLKLQTKLAKSDIFNNMICKIFIAKNAGALKKQFNRYDKCNF